MTEFEDDERHFTLQTNRAKTVFNELINSLGYIVERQQRLMRMSPLDRFIYDKLQDERAKAVIEGMLIGDQVTTNNESGEHTKIMNRLIAENLDADSIWAFAHIAQSIIKRSIFDDPTEYEINLQAREYAHERYKKDPKQADKAHVRECWDDWQKKPDRYKSKAAFARDMRDKFQNLESQPVIEGWCRAWERES
jgi:hypothetical protein